MTDKEPAAPDVTNMRDRIRFARECIGMRPQDLSIAAGLSRAYVGNLESGALDNPSSVALGRIGGLFGICAPWVIAGGAPPPPWRVMAAAHETEMAERRGGNALLSRAASDADEVLPAGRR